MAWSGQAKSAAKAARLAWTVSRPSQSPARFFASTASRKQLPNGATSSENVVSQNAPFMVATYSRPTTVFARGSGLYLWDLEGKQYLDLTGGIAVNALGHSDPEVARVLADQAATLVHASNLYHNPWTGALSRQLIEETRASGGMAARTSGSGQEDPATAVFLANSGTEANEAAIKFARKVGKVRDPTGGKTEIVSFAGAFHGRTLGALSATHNPKYQAPFAPLIPGFRCGTFNDADPATLAALVTPATCGVLVEPIQGEGGVHVGTDAFMVALARRAREVGAVLIHDEIQCGLSRTGGTLWAHAHLPAEAHPDILTTAKALGNGFPIAATLVRGSVADAIQVGDHGTTYGGNPLGARVAHHVLGRLADPALQASVVAKGAVFVRGLQQLRERFPDTIADIRGRGLLLGAQLTGDPTPIVQAARELGLLIITAGTNTLRFAPSLTISEAEIQEGMGLLEQAIAKATK